MENAAVPVVVSEEVRKFISSFPSLSFNEELKKVQCSLTGHDMPCRLHELQKYTNGKKYRKAKERNKDQFEMYQPHIVPSNKKGKEHQLFCTLTLRHINRVPGHVERHVNGRRYKRALQKCDECQKLGIKFKPLTRRKRHDDAGTDAKESRKYSRSATSDTSESEAESDDSLSDLYPRQQMEDGEPHMSTDADGDSHFEVENMDVENREMNGGTSSNEVAHNEVARDKDASSEVASGQKRKKKPFRYGAKMKATKHHHGARAPIQRAFARKRPLKQPRKEIG